VEIMDKFVYNQELADFIKGKRLSTRAAIYCPMIAREFALKKELAEVKGKALS
jgi:hypothetical protein